MGADGITYWAWQHDGQAAGPAAQIAQAVGAYLRQHTASRIIVHIRPGGAAVPEQIGPVTVVLDKDVPAGVTYIPLDVVIPAPEIIELPVEMVGAPA